MVVDNLYYNNSDSSPNAPFTFSDEVIRRALLNIYSQDFHPVSDIEQNLFNEIWRTLNLAAEIGMARGIDDVDFRSLIMHGGILGQNGNAALTLQIARVHHAVHHGLVLAVDAALLEHLIDQRRLAMVNVCDDGDISNVFLIRHGRQSLLYPV